MSHTTSNMSLTIPDSGDTDYPTSIDDSFELIDDHDHTSGKGVQIPAGGLAADAVTTVKILDANVTTAKIADSNVTTAKIADLNVTRAKLAAVGQQVSSSSGNFGTTNTSPTDVTNLSVTITTTGRPVVLKLIADGTTSFSELGIIDPGAGAGDLRAASIDVLRGASLIGRHNMSYTTFNAASATRLTVPVSSIDFLDVVAAGTYTYKVQVFVSDFSGTSSVGVAYAKLVAFEL